jgi:hypothetical protein
MSILILMLATKSRNKGYLWVTEKELTQTGDMFLMEDEEQRKLMIP